MSAGKAKRQPKAQHFTLDDPAVPIAGTPPPRECPFCGITDVVVVVSNDTDSTGKPYKRAHVECTCCGAEAPGVISDTERYLDSYQLVLEAANYWNQRGRKAFAKIPSEAQV